MPNQAKPTAPVVPYNNPNATKKTQVAEMFNNIARSYDFLNRFLSLGIDRTWRAKVVKLLKPYQPKLMLDVATGTADLAIDCLKLNPNKIIGADISEGMLALGREKLKKRKLTNKIELQAGDSENLQFENNTFDAITVAFGVRNFENLNAGLAEMNRVLKPGAPLVVLEFSKPKHFPVKQLYNAYFKYILPTLGKLVSKDSCAYTYLPESVAAFPDGTKFASILGQHNFKTVSIKPLTFGICTAYLAEKNY